MSNIGHCTIAFHININSRLYLTVNVSFSDTFRCAMDIVFLKIQSFDVCMRYNKITEDKRKNSDDKGRNKIWDQKPMKAHTAADYGNNLRPIGHAGCKKNY